MGIVTMLSPTVTLPLLSQNGKAIKENCMQKKGLLESCQTRRIKWIVLETLKSNAIAAISIVRGLQGLQELLRVPPNVNFTTAVMIVLKREQKTTLKSSNKR